VSGSFLQSHDRPRTSQRANSDAFKVTASTIPPGVTQHGKNNTSALDTSYFRSHAAGEASKYCPHTRIKSLLGMRNAHAQDFSAGDELLLAILKAFIPQPLNKQQTKVFHVF
jgi:hypothetical protein